jgi:aromatic ring-opening dioxygenase catalytic subunit (LigB family)
MNTLTTIINSINQNINEEIIDDLTSNLGFDHGTAVKMVTEFEDFDLWLSAEKNPVQNF